MENSTVPVLLPLGDNLETRLKLKSVLQLNGAISLVQRKAFKKTTQSLIVRNPKQEQIMLIDLRRLIYGVSSELDPQLSRHLTPKKVLTPCQDLSDTGCDFANKTFFGVGSLEIWGSNPEERLDTLPRPVRHRV